MQHHVRTPRQQTPLDSDEDDRQLAAIGYDIGDIHTLVRSEPDRMASLAGLEPEARWAGWDRRPSGSWRSPTGHQSPPPFKPGWGFAVTSATTAR